jgi:hypothetical protein
MQKLEGFKVLLIDDPMIDDPNSSTWEPKVEVVDILRINLYLLCKIRGCWVLAPLP